jgi:hypothetical protein
VSRAIADLFMQLPPSGKVVMIFIVAGVFGKWAVDDFRGLAGFRDYMDFASGVSSRICIGCGRFCIGSDGSATTVKLDRYLRSASPV